MRGNATRQTRQCPGLSPLLGLLLALALLLAYAPLARSADEAGLLDVGLVVFDAGIPADESTHSRLGIFPEIRKAEAKYMPVILRDVLVDSGDWGVVRVLPDALDSSELQVTGAIVHSCAGAGRSLPGRIPADCR
ncbi:MAG: hypothetical protein IPG06_11185 [Haliea sp.]|nr:hypothetical protein [Haliea sp.]